jgi:hypothetical protein
MSVSHSEAEQVVVRFNPVKVLLIFAPFAALVALSVLINPDPWRHLGTSDYLVWGGLVLTVILGITILPSRYYLLLSPVGLAVHYVGRQRHYYSWDEMRDFRVVKVVIEPGIPVGQKLAFDLIAQSPNRGTVSNLAGKVLGYEVSILNLYRIRTADLVTLLRQWQERYGTTGGIEQ